MAVTKQAQLTVAQLDQASLSAYQAGHIVQAMQLCGEALRREPSNKNLKSRYSFFMETLETSQFDPEIKRTILICFKDDTLDHQKFASMWASLVVTAPLYAFLFDQTMDDQKYWRSIDALLNDDFFIEGLRRLTPSSAPIERALIRLRRTLLEANAIEGRLRAKHLPLLCAMALQCFYNEYVWPQSDEETALLNTLVPQDAITIALAGAYKPLLNYEGAAAWPAAHPREPMAGVLRAHIVQPLEERDIRATIQSFSPITAGTSQDVQAMYEENPYPRWRVVQDPVRVFNEVTLDWLTAGCGTGRPLTQVTTYFPNARITAIDLSRASMAYAIRKTRERGATNIDFRHGDILHVGDLKKDFDFIESSGVLHHMKNPEEGWKRLLDCLRPGGRMQIGLYSRTARSDVLKVRDFIAQKGYSADLDGIRRLRQDIIDLPDSDPLKATVKRRDFSSTSECRDLVFHIQEENYTIPDLARILDHLGLAFLGFKLSPGALGLYQARFPLDPLMRNLDNWHALEQQNPLLFLGMYNFFCCRKNEVESPRPEWLILEKTGVLSH